MISRRTLKLAEIYGNNNALAAPIANEERSVDQRRWLLELVGMDLALATKNHVSRSHADGRPRDGQDTEILANQQTQIDTYWELRDRLMSASDEVIMGLSQGTNFVRTMSILLLVTSGREAEARDAFGDCEKPDVDDVLRQIKNGNYRYNLSLFGAP